MGKLPKLVNAIIKFIQCHEIPGKYRLYEATKLSYSHKLITYHIKGAEFSIPWDQWCFWKNYGPENYYLDEIEPFTEVVNSQLASFDFFDLGADVGVVSALVNKYCSRLNTIFAFEPNPTAFDILRHNLANISPEHFGYNLAVSDFSGRCQFVFNNDQGSDHEGHLVKEQDGLTEVVALDNFIIENNIEVEKNIAIKLDVEGQEMAALMGAKHLIESANKVVLLLELHPDVLDRDKQTPEDLFALAESIRDFHWLVPLKANREIDRARTFYSQFELQQYDVIGIAG